MDLNDFPRFSDLEYLGRQLAATDRLPLLITGIAGVAGFNAFAYFRQKYGDQVTGQRPKKNWPLSAPGIVGVDLEEPGNMAALLDAGQFKTVLNCGGSCALKGCELDPKMATRVNVDVVESLANVIATRKDVRFVHLSIDLVYSGTHGGAHPEIDATDPVTVYGKTMVAAEDIILNRCPSACILRISLPMGISFNGHAGAIDWIQSRFAKNKPATLYYDEVRTPVYVQCLVETIEEILSGDLQGIFHAGGTRAISLFQIAQVVNRVGGYDPDLLQGCYRIEAGPIPPRAGNVTMNSQRLSAALKRPAFLPWPLFPELVPDSRLWHYERCESPSHPQAISRQLYFRTRP